MGNTRDSLRRGWVYGAILIGCLAYGAYPKTERELALDRARTITSEAIEWVADQINRGPK